MMTSAKLNEEELVQKYQSGKSVLFLAKYFNCSTSAISRRLRKLKIKARPFSTKGLQTRLGAVLSNKTKLQISASHTGKKLSEEHKQAIREWMTQNNPFEGRHHSEESKEKLRVKMSGRQLSSEHRMKVLKGLEKAWANAPRGEASPGWKGGITPVNTKIRNSRQMRHWRKAVKQRDNETCVLCGFKSSSNPVDHIAPFAYFPELRFSVDNGRVLCKPCHLKTDTFGQRYKKKSNQSQSDN